MAEIESELRLLRQKVDEERLQRETVASEQQQLIAQVTQHVHAREGQLIESLKQARETQLNSLVSLGEEKTSAEQRLKMTSDSASTMLR